jgi:hypothetical protein
MTPAFCLLRLPPLNQAGAAAPDGFSGAGKYQRNLVQRRDAIGNPRPRKSCFFHQPALNIPCPRKRLSSATPGSTKK